MGKTLDVARDRAFDQTATVLPAEVARGVYMRNGIVRLFSLTGQKLR